MPCLFLRLTSTPRSTPLRLSHIELVVTDLAASRHFYVETLGPAGHPRGQQADLPARAGRARAPLRDPDQGADALCPKYTSYKVWDDADLDRAKGLL